MDSHELEDFEATIAFEQDSVEFYVEIAIPNEAKREVPLSRESYDVGRARENDIVLDEKTVSRRHAVIQKRAGSYWIQDVGGSGRLTVNGMTTSDHMLAAGDRVMIGAVALVFQSVKGEKLSNAESSSAPRGFITKVIYGFEALVDLRKKRQALGAIHGELEATTREKDEAITAIGRQIRAEELPVSNSDLEARIARVGDLTAELAGKRQVQGQLHSQVGSIENELEKTQSVFSGRMTAARDTVERAESTARSLEASIAKLEAKVSRIRGQVSQLEADATNFEKVGKLRSEMAAFELQISDARSSLERARVEKARAKAEFKVTDEELRLALGPIEKKLSGPKTELETITLAVDGLADDEAGLAREIGTEVYVLRPAIPQLTASFQKLDQLYNRSAQLESQLEELKQWLVNSSDARRNAVIVGSSTLGGLLLLVIGLFWVFGSDSFDVEEAKADVGRVVVVMQVTAPDGRVFYPPHSFGSGFCWEDEGYIITNRHVTSGRFDVTKEQARNPRLKFEGLLYVYFPDEEPYRAELVWESESYDLAILHIDRDSWNGVEFKLTDDVEEGDPVWACGFPGSADPLGRRSFEEIRSTRDTLTKEQLEHSFTNGIVSKITTVPDAYESESYVQIQTNTDINPGNSGGPLMTADNKVVGINTWGRNDASGINFAIAMDDLIDEIRRKIENHKD